MNKEEQLLYEYISENNDSKICEMITNNPELVLKIPKENRTEKHIVIAVKKDRHHRIFPELDDDEKTLKICEIVISTPHGYVCFDYIPQKYKTEEFILRMIDKGGWLINHIDNPTEEMCLRSVKANPYTIHAIKKIRNPTEEMWHIAIENGNGTIFWADNPTEKMMILALKTQGLYNNWRNMPQYYNAVLAYMKKYGNSLKHIKRKLKTYEVCKAAIESGRYAIKFVNKSTLKKHPDLLQLSIEKWGK
jgi:hypothetical protein